MLFITCPKGGSIYEYTLAPDVSGTTFVDSILNMLGVDTAFAVNPDPSTVEFISGQDGKVLVAGLAPGAYTITETEAHSDAYLSALGSFDVTITFDQDTNTFSVTSGNETNPLGLSVGEIGAGNGSFTIPADRKAEIDASYEAYLADTQDEDFGIANYNAPDDWAKAQEIILRFNTDMSGMVSHNNDNSVTPAGAADFAIDGVRYGYAATAVNQSVGTDPVKTMIGIDNNAPGEYVVKWQRAGYSDEVFVSPVLRAGDRLDTGLFTYILPEISLEGHYWIYEIVDGEEVAVTGENGYSSPVVNAPMNVARNHVFFEKYMASYDEFARAYLGADVSSAASGVMTIPVYNTKTIQLALTGGAAVGIFGIVILALVGMIVWYRRKREQDTINSAFVIN